MPNTQDKDQEPEEIETQALNNKSKLEEEKQRLEKEIKKTRTKINEDKLRVEDMKINERIWDLWGKAGRYMILAMAEPEDGPDYLEIKEKMQKLERQLQTPQGIRYNKIYQLTSTATRTTIALGLVMLIAAFICAAAGAVPAAAIVAYVGFGCWGASLITGISNLTCETFHELEKEEVTAELTAGKGKLKELEQELEELDKIQKELVKAEERMVIISHEELMKDLENIVEKRMEGTEENMGRVFPREFVNSVRETTKLIKKAAEKMKEVDKTEMQKAKRNRIEMKEVLALRQRKYTEEYRKVGTEWFQSLMRSINNPLLEIEKGMEYMSYEELMKDLEDIEKRAERPDEATRRKFFPKWFRDHVKDTKTLLLEQKRYLEKDAIKEITIQNKMAEIKKELEETKENIKKMSHEKLIEAVEEEIEAINAMVRRTEQQNHDIPVAVSEETSRDLGDAAKEASEPEAGNKGGEDIEKGDEVEKSFVGKLPERRGSFVEREASGNKEPARDRGA